MIVPDPPLPPTQVPLMEKQPAERLMPLAKVEEAVELVILRALACSPPVKVEVAVPVKLRPLSFRYIEAIPTCKVPLTWRLFSIVEVPEPPT